MTDTRPHLGKLAVTAFLVLVATASAWSDEAQPIQRWAVIGPFDCPYYYATGLERAYPPEQGVELGATYPGKGEAASYKRFSTGGEGTVPLDQLFQPYILSTAYAFARLRSASAQEVELVAAHEGGICIWVNGKEVGREVASNQGTSLKAALKQGDNDILVKVCQLRGVDEGWSFRLAVIGAGVAEVLSSSPDWQALTEAKPAPPDPEAKALLEEAQKALQSRDLGRAMDIAHKLVDAFPRTPEAADAVDVLLSAWASDQAFFATPADYEQASDYSAQVRYLRQLTDAYHDYPVAERAQWGIVRQTLLRQYRAETKVLQEAQRWLLEFPYRPSAEAKGPESYFLRRGTVGLPLYDEVRLYGELLRRCTYPSRSVALAKKLLQGCESLQKVAPDSSAWQAAREGHGPAAVATLCAQADRFPKVKPELILLAGDVARVSGHAEQAASLYARVLNEHRDVERIASKAREALAGMGDLPAQVKEALSGYDAFLQTRDRQLAEWRRLPPDEAQEAQKTLERAEGHELRARHREAQKLLVELVGRAPGFLPARMKLAEVDLALGEAEAATEQYRTVRLIDPTSDDARVNLAKVLFRSDVGLPEAVELLQAVKDNFWNAKEAKFLLGSALLRQDDYEGAIWAFTKARELGYSYWACEQAVQSSKWGFDVNYYMESGRYDEAIKLYSAIEQAFFGHFGGWPFYALKIARLYMAKGDLDAARKALTRVDVAARFDGLHAQHAQEAQELTREIDRLAKEGRPPTPSPAATVAVVGFRAASGQAAQVDQLAASLRDVTEQDLTQLSGLRVLERSQIEEVSQELALAGAGLIRGGLSGIAARIRADLIISAEVAEVGEGLQAKVFLRNTRTGETATLAEVTGKADDLFALADRILAEVQKHPWIVEAVRAPVAERRAAPGTVAVFPFGNAAGIAELQNLGDAMAALLQADLAKAGSVTLVSRENVTAVLEELRLGLAGVLDEATVKQVGQMLSADLFVMGSIVETAGNVRAAVRLVDARSGVLMQTATADAPRDKPEELEAKLLDKLLPALGLSLTPADRQKLAADTSRSMEAELLASEFRDLYWRRRRYDEARHVAEQYLHLRPNDVNMLVLHAELDRDHSTATDAAEQAGTLLRKALSVAPGQPQAAEDLARLLVAQGKYQEAIPVLERAPRREAANFLLGYCYDKAGQAERALAAYRAAGNLPAVKFQLARSAALVGHEAEAIGQYEAGLTQNPYGIAANYELARLYEKAGKTEEARERLRGVVYLDPEHPLAKEAAASPLLAQAAPGEGLLLADAPGIYLLPLGRLPGEDWSAKLAALVESKLGVRCRSAAPLYELSLAYDAPNNCYTTSKLWMRGHELWAWLDTQCLSVVGLTDAPLSIPFAMYERDGGIGHANEWAVSHIVSVCSNYILRGPATQPQATYLGLLPAREPADFNRLAHVVLQMAALDLLGTDEPCSNPQCARCAPKWGMLQLPTRGLCAFCRAQAIERLKRWEKPGSQPETLMISDFETQPDINRWVIQVGSMTLSTDSRYVTHGRGSAKVTIPPGHDYPGLLLNAEHGLPTDWRKYDFVSIDLINPTDAAIQRWEGRAADRWPSRHFTDQNVVPEPGANTITYPVAYLIATDRMRYMDLLNMDQYMLVHLQADFPIQAAMTVYLDNFRLIRDPASRRPPLWMDWADAYALRPDKAEEYRGLMAQPSQVLFDFEKEDDLHAWRAPASELVLSEGAPGATAGGRSLKVTLPAGKDRYLGTSQGWSMPMDWSAFDVLKLNVTNPTQQPIACVVEMQDLYSLSRDWDIFSQACTLPPGTHTLEFPFIRLKTLDNGRLLDRRYMESIYLRFPQLDQPTTLYLDAVRLEKTP